MITVTEIYKGIRGDKFTYFLRQLLSLSNLNKQYYDVLLNDNGLALFDQAFTHRTADVDNNYEYLEFLGDTTLNKSIAWYLSRRFPQLNCPKGVKVLTRIKINLISKRSFSGFARRFNFWDFISADMEVRSTKMEKTLEDVFESFFGATELLLDTHIQQGCGYNICYNMIANMLNTVPISLKYEDLFDSKTRLKEIFDHFGDKLGGKLEYKTIKEDRIHNVEAVIGKKVLGRGSAPLKADAEQRASAEAIITLKKMGFVKQLSDSYAIFCS
jgi:dsRNA-specific ribonuclease